MLFKTKHNVDLVGLSPPLLLWKVLISLKLDNSLNFLNNSSLIALLNKEMKDVMEVLKYGLSSMLKRKEWNLNQLILTKPLMVLRKYIKNIGRDLAFKKADKSKIEGQLIAANEQEITLLTQQKEEVPGKKGKKLVEREIIIPFTEMTEAKVMIRFK
jgi:hypothetical protein